MRVAGIIKDSLCNGPGIRLTVFLQGCNIKCPGCHNPESHDIKGGYEASAEDILRHLTPITTGLTISGGEPTMQWEEVSALCSASPVPVMIYTGRTLEQLIMEEELPENVEYIKAGPYIKSLRSLKEQYGSTNQHIYKVTDSELKDWVLWSKRNREDNSMREAKSRSTKYNQPNQESTCRTSGYEAGADSNTSQLQECF